MSNAQAHANAPKPAHGASGHAPNAHAAHGKKKHKEHAHDGHHGPPPWLISFGDMMTLFLCFFIMLVTMADKQDAGLVAAGLGPFVSELEQHGINGALSGEQRLQAVNTYRARFGMPPEIESAHTEGLGIEDLSRLEELLAKGLRRQSEIPQPSVAVFTRDSAELSDSAREYLDLLAETLRPAFGQVLVLEGHATDAGSHFHNDDAWLATARAQAVRAYLIDKHGLVTTRVEARGWLGEGEASSAVDARLVQPMGRD